jgi:hypothetical protein
LIPINAAEAGAADKPTETAVDADAAAIATESRRTRERNTVIVLPCVGRAPAAPGTSGSISEALGTGAAITRFLSGRSRSAEVLSA